MRNYENEKKATKLIIEEIDAIQKQYYEVIDISYLREYLNSSLIPYWIYDEANRVYREIIKVYNSLEGGAIQYPIFDHFEDRGMDSTRFDKTISHLDKDISKRKTSFSKKMQMPGTHMNNKFSKQSFDDVNVDNINFNQDKKMGKE